MKVPVRRRSRRVSESIASRIQSGISQGRLRPGERLPAEREMARRFKTSRVSVREAYRSLEEMGLLRIRRGAEGGAFISDVGDEPVIRSLSLMLRLGKTSHEELTEARLLIEPPIARLAALRAGPADVARLDEVVRKQEASLTRTGDMRPYDLQFHRMVAECAKNLPLKALMNSLSDLTVEVVSGLSLAQPTQHKVCEFHRVITEAIRRGDGDAAFVAMQRHVADVQGQVARTIAAQAAG
jgi:GntR family transcriptional repressor for pyruvate dehydrogenase complex